MPALRPSLNMLSFVFEAFGDRVKHWITFNESWCTAVLGYGVGLFAPGRISPDEPYMAGHNLLLAHGLAVKIFREKNYPGVIGIANNCDWREPLTDSLEDQAAAQRSLEFFYGWFTDPVVFGDYPSVMRERLGERLPSFSEEQKSLLKGSVDFLGLNHYTTHMASVVPATEHEIGATEGNGGMADDQEVYLSFKPEWSRTGNGWFVVPWGFRKMLNWIEARYGRSTHLCDGEWLCGSGGRRGWLYRGSIPRRFYWAIYRCLKGGPG